MTGETMKPEEKKSQLLDSAKKGLEKLCEQLATAKDTEELRQWLAFSAKFHNYSMRNQMLIRLQRPNASRCAGFNAWKKLGRFVRKGEKGIMILAPCVRSKKTDEKGEAEQGKEKAVFFRVTYVFDISQTEGEEIPCHPAINTESAKAEDLARVEAGIRKLCPIVEDATPYAPGVMGWTDGKAIHVSEGQTTGSRMSVLIHEAAHVLLHFGHDAQGLAIRHDRTMAELEAESTAAAVSTALGYDFGKFSAAYISHYGATKESLSESLPRITGAVKKILELFLQPLETEEE